jgi:hypothetical protein
MVSGKWFTRANHPEAITDDDQPQPDINDDMKRTFNDKVADNHIYEDDIVSILKDLIKTSDVLLNLHDAYGYYRPEWESDIANPKSLGTTNH